MDTTLLKRKALAAAPASDVAALIVPVIDLGADE
jgi:hypothetical protein